MRKELIDSTLLTHLARFYPSLCTIQSYNTPDRDDYHLDTYGQPDPMWEDLYTDLACTVAAAGGQEMKTSAMTTAIASHRIALAGYYPLITPKMKAVVGDNTYDILLVEVDSHGEMTRLTTQIVS